MRVQLRVERRRSSRKKSSCTLMLSSWTWQWLLKTDVFNDMPEGWSLNYYDASDGLVSSCAQAHPLEKQIYSVNCVRSETLNDGKDVVNGHILCELMPPHTSGCWEVPNYYVYGGFSEQTVTDQNGWITRQHMYGPDPDQVMLFNAKLVITVTPQSVVAPPDQQPEGGYAVHSNEVCESSASNLNLNAFFVYDPVYCQSLCDADVNCGFINHCPYDLACYFKPAAASPEARQTSSVSCTCYAKRRTKFTVTGYTMHIKEVCEFSAANLGNTESGATEAAVCKTNCDAKADCGSFNYCPSIQECHYKSAASTPEARAPDSDCHCYQKITSPTSAISTPGNVGLAAYCVSSDGSCFWPGDACNQKTAFEQSKAAGLTRTLSGYTCQAWSAQSPYAHNRDSPQYWEDTGITAQEAGNYCANPDFVGGGKNQPWCFTTNPFVRIEACLPVCTHKCIWNDCAVDGPNCDRKSAFEESVVLGIRTTISGYDCMNWRAQGSKVDASLWTETGRTVDEAENYCANPDSGSPSGGTRPWCYTNTTEPSVTWEYCYPAC